MPCDWPAWTMPWSAPAAATPARELHAPPLPPHAVRLAGLDYALLRTAVRDRRPAVPRSCAPSPGNRVPQVVAFFGGTDAFRAAPVVGRLLFDADAPFDATVV